MIFGRFGIGINFLKKKFKKMPTNVKIQQIFEISKFDLRPEMADNRPISIRKAPLAQKSSQNFFWPKRIKIYDFNPEKHTPPPKRPFFHRKMADLRFELWNRVFGLRECFGCRKTAFIQIYLILTTFDPVLRKRTVPISNL